MAKVHFLNVGHGDCTIIEHGNGNLTMIDINNGDDIDRDSYDAISENLVTTTMAAITKGLEETLGTPRRKILSELGYKIGLTNPIEFLKRTYPDRSIFRYIQSHPDFDHMRGLAALEKSGISIYNFWDTPHSRQWREGEDKASDLADWNAYQRLRAGPNPKRIKVLRGATGKYFNQNEDGTEGGNGLQILSPTEELLKEYDVDKQRNEISYVLEYRVGGRSIIFGGDAEQGAWESIYEHYGSNLKCDVLKASHHGRDSGFHSKAVAAMNPEITVVSVGKKPETDASQKYRNHSSQVISTRWHGDITLEINSNGAMDWTGSQDRK